MGRTFMHASVDKWIEQISQGNSEAIHAVVSVDAGNITADWGKQLKPQLESVLPQGSLFIHLTQSRDEEAVKDKEGEEAPHFAWCEVFRLQLMRAKLEFQRLERRDWD